MIKPYRLFHALLCSCWILVVLAADPKPIATTSDIPLTTQQSPEAVANGAICENRVSAFFVSDNTGVVETSSMSYEDVTEDECLKMCSENRDNKGRSILCASFIYDQAFFVCTIYRTRGLPDGDLETKPDAGKRFFEKFCIDEALPVECADSKFLRADQSVIIGYAKNVSIVESLEECALQCMKERFTCKSAMYFYEEGECITNTQSATERPAAFAHEESDKVIYIQNGCDIVIQKQKLLQPDAETDEKPKKKKLKKPSSTASAPTTEAAETTQVPKTTTLEADRMPLSDKDAKSVQDDLLELIETLGHDKSVKKEDIDTSFLSDKKHMEEPSKEKSIEEVTKETEHEEKEDTTDGEEGKEAKEDASSQKPEPKEELDSKQESVSVTEPTDIVEIEMTTTQSSVEYEEMSGEGSGIDEELPKEEEYPAKPLPIVDDGAGDEQTEAGLEQGQSTDQSEAETTPETQSETPSKTTEEEETPVEEEEDEKAASQFKKHPKALSVEEQNKKGSHKKHKKLSSHAIHRPVHKEKIFKESSKSLETHPIELPTEKSLEEELEMNEVNLKKAKASSAKSSKKLKIKAIQNEEAFDEQEEVPNYFSTWTEWSPCLSSGERKIRRRKCLDLRRCIGALMEIASCPENIAKQHDTTSKVRTIVSAGPAEPEVRPAASTSGNEASEEGLPPGIMPAKKKLGKKKSRQHVATTHKATEEIWSPWLGVCQEFASGQPCKDHEVIGFESRECIAKNPSKCIGPFFRYCTLPC